MASVTIPTDEKPYQWQIEATARQIDAPAYDLYGLTDEVIAVVEETDS